jgi:hypothetical protein
MTKNLKTLRSSREWKAAILATIDSYLLHSGERIRKDVPRVSSRISFRIRGPGWSRRLLLDSPGNVKRIQSHDVALEIKSSRRNDPYVLRHWARDRRAQHDAPLFLARDTLGLDRFAIRSSSNRFELFALSMADRHLEST